MVLKKGSAFRRVDYLFILFFYISFFASALGTLFYLALLFYWRHGVEGAVKALFLMTARGILSTAVAASGSNTVKLVIMLATSLYIIFTAELEPRDRRKAKKTILMAVLFAVFAGISSLITSSYPVTAISKVISFVLPFCAMLLGVGATRKRVDWSDYFTGILLTLLAISFVLIPFSRFRIVNDRFQGVFNHVNILGIVAALFTTGMLNSGIFKQKKAAKWIVIAAVLWMIYLSGSRTGMLSALAAMAVYYLTQKIPTSKRFLAVLIVLFVILVTLLVDGSGVLQQIEESVHSFLYKGHTESMWYSREGLLEEAQHKYRENPMIGSGFMVPHDKLTTDYSLRFDLTVESGNLFWALLGDTGILGLCVFALFFVTLLFNGSFSRLYLLVGAFAINMGEMVFFSSNNMAIFVYFLVALFVFPVNDKASGATNMSSIL